MAQVGSIALLVTVALSVSACGTGAGSADTAPTTRPAESSPPPTETASTDTAPTGTGDVSEQMFPDVIDAAAERVGSTWTISATISSPYDTPERYADAWRVLGPDGTVYGERILTHDHAAEQPFTRSESGIEIPDEVTEVVIEGRDLEYGYGGGTFTLNLP